MAGTGVSLQAAKAGLTLLNPAVPPYVQVTANYPSGHLILKERLKPSKHELLAQMWAGSSSSAHSDASHQLTAVNNANNSTSTSRQATPEITVGPAGAAKQPASGFTAGYDGYPLNGFAGTQLPVVNGSSALANGKLSQLPSLQVPISNGHAMAPMAAYAAPVVVEPAALPSPEQHEQQRPLQQKPQHFDQPQQVIASVPAAGAEQQQTECPQQGSSSHQQPPPPAEAATAVDAAANAAAPQAAAAELVCDVPTPLALPPPSPSEGPQAAVEYGYYMERWSAGVTLAQRWHRLAQKGKIDDIRADWEEWEQDLMLLQLQQQLQASNKGRARKREETSEPDVDAPRQTRQRRVPNALLDYQVEAPATSGPLEGGNGGREDTPGFTTKPYGRNNSAAAKQQQRGGALSDDGDASYSEGEAVQRPRNYQQARRNGPSKVYRPPAQQQQQSQAMMLQLCANPAQQQYQQQQHPQQRMQQQQQWGRCPQQQQQQQQQAMTGAAGPAGVNPELMSQLYQMGTAMGAALQQQAGGAPAAAAAPGPAFMPGQASGPQNPTAAMAAAMEMCARMWGNDPALFAQHMGVAFGQPQ